MSQPVRSLQIDKDKMHAFLGKFVGDFGASLSSMLAYIGTKLGLYEALADSDGLTPEELAAKTSTNERYVREWLLSQAACRVREISHDSCDFSHSQGPELIYTAGIH